MLLCLSDIFKKMSLLIHFYDRLSTLAYAPYANPWSSASLTTPVAPLWIDFNHLVKNATSSTLRIQRDMFTNKHVNKLRLESCFRVISPFLDDVFFSFLFLLPPSILLTRWSTWIKITWKGIFSYLLLFQHWFRIGCGFSGNSREQRFVRECEGTYN